LATVVPAFHIQSIVLAFKRFLLHGLAAWQKLFNFQGYGASQDERGGLTDPFRGGRWSCFSCSPQITGMPPPHAEF